MLDFNSSNENDYRTFGKQLCFGTQNPISIEDTAQCITESLYNAYLKEDYSVLAMVRIFQILKARDLPAYLRDNLRSDEEYALALLGTYGLEENWRHRRLSASHQVIPITPENIHRLVPMFEEILVRQMGVNIHRLYETDSIVEATTSTAGLLYVPDMMTSPLITTQEEFVIPYGLQSEVGFGGVIAFGDSYSLYTLFAFSREPISQKAAKNFTALQPFIGMALARKTGQPIFNDA